MGQVRSLAIESWTLYAIALLFVAARMYDDFHEFSPVSWVTLTCPFRTSRKILLGSFRKLQLDDYIMLFIVVSCPLIALSS